MLRTGKYAVMAAALATIFSARALAGPEAVPPAATPFHVGAYELVSLRDMAFVEPNDGKTFGVGEPESAVADVLRKAGAPTDKIMLSVDALLVKMPGHVVLIDTGLGPKIGGDLMQSLALAGVKPDAVTDVLITHSHGDHVGGLVTADGKSAFPKAVIRMSKTEWAWMQGHKGAATIVRAVAGQMKPFTPGTPILPGITPIAIPGHTPGHVGYQIESKGRHLFDVGDTVHSSIISLAKPQWAMGFDNDEQQGEASREKVLAKLAADHERIFAPHFPYPGVGYIVKKGDGYGWVPDLKPAADKTGE